MPEPPSPLTAASATLSFLDFATNFLETALKGSALPGSTTQDPQELAREAEQLKTVDATRDLPKDLLSDKQAADAKDTEAERGLQRVLERCKLLADKVIAALQGCQVESKDGSKSVKVDEKRKGEVEKCRKEMETLRVECASQLLRLLNERQSADAKKLDRLRQRDASMEAQVARRFERLRQELTTALGQKGSKDKDKSSRPLSIILNDMLIEARHVKLAQEILLSLRYDGMESRKHTIAETHGVTYEWVFSSPKSLRRQKGMQANFSEWLEKDGGIFWITGHAGSGKSTLMKFVENHETTRAKLQEWATGYKLVKAGHYFWVNGSGLQKSQLGLLRALCFAILRQCPDLLPQLCEERWNAGDARQQHEKEWSISELQRILHLLQTSEFKETDEKVRFAFFVDGLDEYSGDYEELLSDLRQLATSPHIKICAASRPWNLFEEALGRDPTRMLTMQELTSDDIAEYVRDTLEDDAKFLELEKHDARAAKLVDDIISRANGVFLWVYLVVRRILRSINNGDSLEVVEENVSHFPSNLDDYFKHMLDTVDIFQQRETAQIFRVCIRARQPLALLAFSILDPDNPISKRLASDQAVDQKDVDAMHDKMDKQIRLRGPDLLEVIRDGRYIHVTFTHRSVRDFLTHNNMDTLFESRTGADFQTGEPFEPLSALCRMTLLTLQRLELITDPETAREHYYALITDCLDYAQDLEVAQHTVAFRELNQLESILEANAATIATKMDTNRTNPLLPLAIRRNLCLFIKQRAAQGPSTLQPTLQAPDRPLLHYALPRFTLRAPGPPTFLPEMTSILLTNGSNPNTQSYLHDAEPPFTLRKGSIYFLYLRTLYSLSKRPKLRPRGSGALMVTEALIEAGASYVPNCLTEDGNKGEREILEFCFGKVEAARLVGLRAAGGAASAANGGANGSGGQEVKGGRTGSGTARRPSWAKARSSFRRLSIGTSGSAVSSS